MTVDWGHVKDSNFGIPFGVSKADLVVELEQMLTDRDPAVRDDLAYPVLATWVERGVLDDQLEDHGNRLVVMLGHREPQARSFAVLALGEVVGRVAASPGPLVPTGVVRAWLVAVCAWYVEEQDRQAWRPEVGWLHVPAHGADTLGVFALSPRLSPTDVDRVAVALLVGLSVPSSPLYGDGEDARVAQALYAACCREDVSAATVAGWFLRAKAVLAVGLGGPRTPPWVSNTVRTLQMLYLLVDSKAAVSPSGVPMACAHAETVKNGIVHALGAWWPPLRP